MRTRLLFTVKYNNTLHEFSWIIDTVNSNHSVWTRFSNALKEICPGVRLPSPGNLVFVETDEGKIELQCKKQLTINGVGLNSRMLKPDDRIILGPIRLFFKSAERVSEPQIEIAPSELHVPKLKMPSLPRFPRLLPAALISAAAAGAIIAGCMTAPKTDSSQTAVLEKASIPQAAAVTEEPAPEDLSAADSDAPELSDDAAPQNIAAEEAGPLIIVAPGEIIPEYDLDILFIHAHPDDESLDFGCLAAMADAAGLATGLVNFTDGGAGLDRHPFRPQTGIYPDHPMAGEELAKIRSTELTYAADVLGIDLLIRLGRRNNPYNSSSDELPAPEIFKGWGGKAAIESLLQLIILRTSPETVAAPEGPGLAREHFEHEAVGALVAGVMDSMSEKIRARAPERFITCIDPRQHELYPEAVELDAASYRGIQLEALSKHKTQNDAVNVGTGFLPGFPYEYYKIQYWRTNESWEKWIAGLEGNTGSLAARNGGFVSAIQ